MKKIINPITCREVHALLFCVFILLYVWPLLSTFGQGRPGVLFVYYHSVLAVHTLALYWVSRYSNDSSRRSDDPPRTHH